MATEQKVKESVVHRLSYGVYLELERQCPKPLPDSRGDTAFNLGVQFVLEKLRNGIVEP